MPLNGAKRNRRVRSYPGHSLEETLRVAFAIHWKNADLPLDRELLAKELSTTPKSSSFTTILSASKQYGLTEGGYRDQDISLTPLGLSAVASRSDTEKMRSLTAAAYLPLKFKALREHLQGSPLPEVEFLQGLLTRDLQISSSQTGEYINIYTANEEFLNRQTNPSPSKKPRRSSPTDNNPPEENNSPPQSSDKGIVILVPLKVSSLTSKLEQLFTIANIKIELLSLTQYQATKSLQDNRTKPSVAATIIPLEGHIAQCPEAKSQSSSAFLVGLALGITTGPVIILTTENSVAFNLPPIDPGFKAMIHTLEYKDDDLAQLDLIKLLTSLGTLKLSL